MQKIRAAITQIQKILAGIPLVVQYLRFHAPAWAGSLVRELDPA